ncbi:MAG: TauD/TfdA dioxygenase family protein [Candidatus Latescibacterota bacterium]|jgi:taurine dioxygenase
MEIILTGEALGAEIRGLDLTQPLSPAQIRSVRQALLDHSAVFLRDQQISDEDQVRFTGYFGQPVPHVRKQRERHVKEIFIISNVKENGEPIGALGHDEIGFHSDLSYLRQPGTLSVLYAVEIPKDGGNTQWCNCTAAYAALDDAMKERLQGLRAVHLHYVEEQNPPEMIDHPIVCTHPETGGKSLYVGPHLTKYVVGLSAEESQSLLDELYAHLDQPRFVWTHRWRVGDLILWDNRPTMHRRLPFPPEQRRIMNRTQIFNDEIPIE